MPAANDADGGSYPLLPLRATNTHEPFPPPQPEDVPPPRGPLDNPIDDPIPPQRLPVTEQPLRRPE